MPKFNTNDKRGNRSVTSPVVTVGPPATGHQGGPGYARDAKSELYLLALAHLGEKTFYESAKHRDDRFEGLVAQVAVADPEWMKGFLPWLRRDIGMRYASIVATGVTVKAWLDAKIPGGRQLIADVLTRGDEPGEFLAFWQNRYMTAKKRGADGLVTGGQHFPKPVMRGVADGIRKLGTERNLLKWDTESHGWRFADILAMVHPAPKVWWQDKVFGAAIDRRFGRPVADDPALRMLRLNRELRAHQDVLSTVSRADFPEMLRDAGFTWEDALSLWGGKVQKNLLWEAMIPSMGLLALIRNLRNFDEAGVSEQVAMKVVDKLKSADDIKGARLFPFQIFAAYKEAPSLRWAYPLEQALNLSLGNVPELPNRTLIMVDTSGSMNSTMTALGKMTYWETAALFGVALASRAQSADVVSYSDGSKVFPLTKGESVLKALDRFRKGYFIGGGTDTYGATNAHYQGHDRVIILTDEQVARPTYAWHVAPHLQGFQVPAHVPIYTWNLAGYKLGHNMSGADNRHTFGGLSDQSFRMIRLLEAGQSQKWPWMD